MTPPGAAESSGTALPSERPGDVGSQIVEGLLAAFDPWYFSTASSRNSLVGNTVRISIRVAAPSTANVRTESKAFGSSRNPPCRNAIRTGGVISVEQIHSE